MIDTKGWKNVTMDDSDQVGIGYARLIHLFTHDPLVTILAPEARVGLCGAIFSNHGIAEGERYQERLAVHTPAEVRTGVMDAFALSPLSILGDGFKEHVAGLVILAIFPEDV